MHMKHNAWRLCLLTATVLLIGASCGASVDTNGAASVNLNGQQVNLNAPVNAVEDIIYGTNMDPAIVEQSREDCKQRGGTFSECGSACKEGEMCIAACALRCDF